MSSAQHPSNIRQLLDRALENQRAGNLAEAESFLRKSLEMNPLAPDALHLLGVVLGQRGNPAEAVECLRKAVTLNPDIAEWHHHLADNLGLLRRFHEAINGYERAIQLKPDFSDAHNNLGNALLDLGRANEAVTCYRNAIRLSPEAAGIFVNLGNALQRLGKINEAAVLFRKAVRMQPDLYLAHNNLGNALQSQGRVREAIPCYREAIRYQPDFHEAHNNLGTALQDVAQLSEAIASYEKAVQLRPDFAMAHGNLANALREHGRLDAAVARYHEALRLHPGDPLTHSNLLFTLNHHPAYDNRRLFEAHAAWGARHADPLLSAIAPHCNQPVPERPLKLGYISPDFRKHVVAVNLEPVLRAHDHNHFEIYCYASVVQPDATTQRLRRCADYWRDILHLSDADAADLIRRDGIDVLVELAGHTANHRLLTLARKPAPVQISYLGYVNTTGMRAIDCRFTDVHGDPEGATERFHTEELVRLPETALCYRPPDASPDVRKPPALDSGLVTFGSFNTLTKMTLDVVRLWSRVLQAVPRSRLLLKTKQLGDAAVREYFIHQFNACGIGAERLEFIGWSRAGAEHLETYHRVDIGMDTFPFNGGITTFESLWMGVPVITLAGDHFVSRLGVRFLALLDLREFIAPTQEAYVETAVRLAGDPTRLRDLRFALRERLLNSPLMNNARIVQHLENAYRDAWCRWCAGPRSPDSVKPA
ncbi:MAG: tetratricopeptide repeat protein [Verrucomicrobia bacterium]|nr:tetratricopeptide repeat protein [Verrucomicrobiota bacterium]